LNLRLPLTARPGRLAAALAITLVAAGTVTSAAYAADPTDQISNGTFDSTTDPWWQAGLTIAAVNGELCTTVPGGAGNPWDHIVGYDLRQLVNGETYKLTFDAHASVDVQPRVIVGSGQDPFPTYSEIHPSITGTTTTFSMTFQSNVDDSVKPQVGFQIGGASMTDWTLCIDNVSFVGGQPPPEFTWNTDPRLHVNQTAYLPNGPKFATLTTDATAAVPFQLVNSAGTVVFRGTTRPVSGTDKTSNSTIQTIDFSHFSRPGTGYTLVADGVTSFPFAISADPYEQLRKDSLGFYYTQRSGIAIDNAIAPGYGRPAGHVGVAPNQGDTAVPCAAPKNDAGDYIGPRWCDYTLDVSGGWYDAGDHGKYVVNGGISVWQLMSIWERERNARVTERNKLGDGTLAIPESHNGVPDVLDEARFELEWMLKMQVPAGKPSAGMVFHSVHDQKWTGLPTLPSDDSQPRELVPPTTAATLNFAAVMAQGARVFAQFDRAFSARMLAAARVAWTAANANPVVLAQPGGVGGGAYDDQNLSDEYYWAAVELFLTTGERSLAQFVAQSPVNTADIFVERGFDWQHTATPGRLDLATVPAHDGGLIGLLLGIGAKLSVLSGAQKYLNTQASNGWALAYSPSDNQFDWGSNNLVLNNLQVIATAFDLTGAARYRNAVVQGIDYILGRNAINQSFVTSYGTINSHQQHSRWYDHEERATLPPPPHGAIAGGPNSGLQDPPAAANLGKCRSENKPQFCYIDEVQSYSTNEVAINWNSTLAWEASFIADQNNG
jgi:endoglucanase